MITDLITREDLKQFKEELLNDIQAILRDEPSPTKQFLKSREVMDMLKCSESKLASLRKSGKLPCKKIEGTYYYDLTEVLKLLK